MTSAEALKLKEIAQQSATMKTLSCKFRQVQESPMLKTPEISTGNLQFLSSGTLVWKYETPKLFQLSLLEDRIVMTSDKGVKSLPLADNPMMEQIRDFFIGLVNGDRLKPDGDGFECSLREKDNQCIVTMTPKSRQLRKAFASMEFTFTGTDCRIGSVVLYGAKGGKTTVTFTDHKITR